jgi:hypothetical protein
MRETALSLKNQRLRLQKTINLADQRYTPKLNVEVSIYDYFYAIARTREFFDKFKLFGTKISKEFWFLDKKKLSTIAPTEFKTFQVRLKKLIDFISSTPDSGAAVIDFPRIARLTESASAIAYKCQDKLYAAEEAIKNEESTGSDIANSQAEDLRTERHHLRELLAQLHGLENFSNSRHAGLSNKPFMLLRGVAGSGKTHLLCDLAENRIALKQPTFIFLGEEFRSKDPWDTILKKTGFSGTPEQFLKKLNKYAKNKKVRALIIVDAVNEALAKKVQWSKLEMVKDYEYIGLIISIRNGFEREHIPSRIQKNFNHIEHEGFAFREWEAVNKFFGFYGIPLPEIPLTFPEFRIPLFLKIFCESAKSSTEPIKGHFGFTRIFEDFVIAQGKKVLRSLGDTSGDSMRKIWNGTIKELALEMAHNGTDRIDESSAESIAKNVFPTKYKDALVYLEKFGLITKIPRYGADYKQTGFDFRFPYQKFSDHLIVRGLLTEHLKGDPKKCFKRGTPLGGIILDRWNPGLVEALSIQVPERLKGRELIYVAPRRFRDTDVAVDAFLQSLIWRDLKIKDGRPQSIKITKVLNYINNYLIKTIAGNEKVLETLIAVSAIPTHPLNGKLLHKHLLKFKMAERDRFWLPFLNSYYHEQSSVDRLINWAWSDGDKTRVSKESLYLASIPLGWFLASSNRFIRDAATKALVALLEKHQDVLLKFVESFIEVNDPYVVERILCVTYGCVLRNSPSSDTSKIALLVYSKIFKEGNPPSHILIRDYARQIIEFAVRYENLPIALDKVRPPYNSKFPKRAPTVKYLEEKYPSSPGGGGFGSIRYSLMYGNGGGIADFGRYIAGSTLSHWSSVPLKQRTKTSKEKYEDFVAKLNRKQKYWWKNYQDARKSYPFVTILASLRSGRYTSAERAEHSRRTKEYDDRKKVGEKNFVATLSPYQKRVFREIIIPYDLKPNKYEEVDQSFLQRLIFKRVIDLGWTPEYFADFDSRVSENMRSAHKPERIGKKYQWMGLHQVMGLVADNFAMRRGWGDELTTYDGVWDTYRRDIDPSHLLKRTALEPFESTSKAWWSRIPFKSWKPRLTDVEWVKDDSTLPQQKKLLEVKDKKGRAWLVLDGTYRWEQPLPPGTDRYGAGSEPIREVWYQVRTYLIREKDSQDFFEWTKGKQFLGGWLPEARQLHEVYLREFPDCLAYTTQENLGKLPRWTNMEDEKRKQTKFKVLRTTERYTDASGEFDCSLDESVHVNLPAKEILRGLHLRNSEREGVFVDTSGNTIVQDPSVFEKGSTGLLVAKKEFLAYLSKHRLALICLVAGEKLMIGGDSWGAGRLEVGGTYKLSPMGVIKSKTYKKYTPPVPRIKKKKAD